MSNESIVIICLIRHPKISLSCARDPAYNLLDAPLTLRQHKAVQKMRTYVPTQCRDKLTWTLSSSGLFSVSSAYTVLSQGGKLMTPIASLWRTRATPSMKLFVYLMLNNRILTHDNMQRRNIPHPLGCVMCPHGAPESVMHLFFRCSFARQIWINVSTHLGFPVITMQDSILETYISSRPPDRQSRKTWGMAFITTTWLLWKERNQRTFRHTCSTVQVLTARILQEIDLCYTYC